MTKSLPYLLVLFLLGCGATNNNSIYGENLLHQQISKYDKHGTDYFALILSSEGKARYKHSKIWLIANHKLLVLTNENCSYSKTTSVDSFTLEYVRQINWRDTGSIVYTPEKLTAHDDFTYTMLFRINGKKGTFTYEDVNVYTNRNQNNPILQLICLIDSAAKIQ